MDLSATTTPDTEDLIITENSEVGIYEAVLGGETVAGVIYSKTGNRVTLLATSVFRAQGETATITCPFAAEFVSAHPEYADVLDSAVPGNSTNAMRRH